MFSVWPCTTEFEQEQLMDELFDVSHGCTVALSPHVCRGIIISNKNVSVLCE